MHPNEIIKELKQVNDFSQNDKDKIDMLARYIDRIEADLRQSRETIGFIYDFGCEVSIQPNSMGFVVYGEGFESFGESLRDALKNAIDGVGYDE